MLLPGSPASPEGPGGPRAPGIPMRPGSPRNIIMLVTCNLLIYNHPIHSNFITRHPAAFYLLYPHGQVDSFSIMYLEMNRKESWSENNSIRFTASSIICYISMLTRLTLYSFPKTSRHIPQHKSTAIFFHSFNKLATSHIRSICSSLLPFSPGCPSRPACPVQRKQIVRD